MAYLFTEMLTDGVLEMNLSTFTLTCFCCLIGASAHQYQGDTPIAFDMERSP